MNIRAYCYDYWYELDFQRVNYLIYDSVVFFKDLKSPVSCVVVECTPCALDMGVLWLAPTEAM